MPRIRTQQQLTELVKDKLLESHWWNFNNEPLATDDELADLWDEHRDSLLAEYKPPSFAPDRPAWGEYVFDLVPVHGPRRGVDADEPNAGYNRDDSEVEDWKTYLRRCGISR